MESRVLTNKGQPFLDEGGNPQKDICLSFQLWNIQTGQPEDAFDKYSGEQIYPTSVIVSVNTALDIPVEGLSTGEFSITLWPTGAADHDIYYQVKMIGGATVRTFVKKLPEGEDALTWFEFITGVQPVAKLIADDGTDIRMGDGSTITPG